MGEFFKGWRRKAGLVTLAMAMVLTVSWMRSYVIFDILALSPDKHSINSLISKDGSIGWAQVTYGENHVSVLIRWQSLNLSNLRPRPSDLWELYTFEWRWRGRGFDFGKAKRNMGGIGEHGFAIWEVPYWTLVLPLTLLSALLIFIKPRTAKSQKPDSTAI